MGAGMNIWAVHQYAVPPQTIGLTRMHGLAHVWEELGSNCRIIAGGFNHHTKTRDWIGDGERHRLGAVGGVDYLWLPVRPYAGNSIQRIVSMAKFGWDVAQAPLALGLPKPDLVFASSPHLFAAWGALRLAEAHRVPFVLEVRDLWPQSLVELGGLSAHHPVVKALEALERHLYRRATSVFTLLPQAERYLLGRGARRVQHFPNGTNLDWFPPTESPASGPFVLVYSGAYGLANSLATLLDAMALLQAEGWGPERLQLRLIGSGADEARLKAMSANNPLVSWHEPVPRNELANFLAQAHAGVILASGKALYKAGLSPNKVFDYFAAQLPVLFSTNEEANLVTNAGAGFATPADSAEALAEGVRRLVAMAPEARQAMGARGRRVIEEGESYERIATAMLQALKALA